MSGEFLGKAQKEGEALLAFQLNYVLIKYQLGRKAAGPMDCWGGWVGIDESKGHDNIKTTR